VYGALIATGVGLAIVGLLPTLLQNIVSTGTREGEGLETLSGRTIAFSYLIEQWRHSPLLGYGFGAGTRNWLLDFLVRRGMNIGAGHDALSTVLVDLGLVGLSLLLVAFVSAWIALGRLYRTTASDQQRSIGAHQVACLLVWVTIQTVVSTSLAGPYQVFIVAMVAVWTLRRRHAYVAPEASLQRQSR